MVRVFIVGYREDVRELRPLPKGDGGDIRVDELGGVLIYTFVPSVEGSGGQSRGLCHGAPIAPGNPTHGQR